MGARNAILTEDIPTGYNRYSTTKFKIRVIEIVADDIFPVKYEYKARGYKGLVFSTMLRKIE